MSSACLAQVSEALGPMFALSLSKRRQRAKGAKSESSWSAAPLRGLPRSICLIGAGEIDRGGGTQQHRGHIVFGGMFRAHVTANADALLAAANPKPAVFLAY